MWVIKHGVNYKEIDCPHCAAKLAYYLADIKRDVKEVMGVRVYKDYLVCAECRKMITLKETHEEL